VAYSGPIPFNKRKDNIKHTIKNNSIKLKKLIKNGTTKNYSSIRLRRPYEVL